MTKITTTARRIARDSNMQPSSITIYYDKSGHMTGSIERGMWYQKDGGQVFPKDTVYQLDGHKNSPLGRMTYKEAQAMIDEKKGGLN
ncbi:hypothetical protein PQ472_07800 [Lacticaseibacillus pabuli]|uniref:YD repeat-containing protein n=1 Tax=Lacticaseibacillus pabuli TaxID=3025672 RepID=A0ABY7WNR7_9LACO|nr:hypothetical protein [Lacticaseibacillus sp. KACC 23028]WDF81828.1 hypothetical protein PQ472_07800 [Lacticaseibacillus sp. KACC 23028]